MGEMLSREEVEKLLSAVSSGKISVRETRKVFKKTATPYDFRQADIVPKDQIRLLERIHQNFIHIYVTPLANYLRTIVEFELIKVEQIKFIEFMVSLPNPTYINILDLSPLKGRAILEINPSLTFAIIDLLLGGLGRGADEARELTDIEHSIMEKVVFLTLDYLKQAWKPIFPFVFKVQSTETNPQFAQIVGGEERVISITMEGRIGKSSGLMNLCIPYLTIKPIISKLASQYRAFSDYESVDKEQNSSMEKAMGKVEVTLVAELGKSQITIKDFLQLGVGDVIRLGQNIHQNIIVKVENSPKFYAIPGRVGKQMAVQVSSLVEPKDNVKEKKES